MPVNTHKAVHRNTPTVTVRDNRGLVVREISYHRHPTKLHQTDTRITRHRYDAHGFKVQSSDPRLHAAGLSNFTWLNDLGGQPLRTCSVDTGVIVQLADAAGRPRLAVTPAVTRTWHYETAQRAGRALGISEQVTGQPACRIERIVYAGNSAAEQAVNLAGQVCLHFDTAGLLQTHAIALSGVPQRVTRRLLAAADNPLVTANWQGTDADRWEAALQPPDEGACSTTLADATGAALAITDAAGNLQEQDYDVAGLLKGTWLTLKGSRRQVILKAMSYSAAGQKLHEEHGNGLITRYRYEPRTQRLAGLRTERPQGHALGAKVLQDLHYGYDPVGNVLKVRDDAEAIRFWRNQKIEPECTYSYDSLYQLASATGREMANAARQGHQPPERQALDNATFTQYTRAYDYDSAGNLMRIRHSAPASGNNYTLDITISDRSNRGVTSALTEDPAQVDRLFTPGGMQKVLAPGQQLVWTSRGELHSVSPIIREGGASDQESYRYDIGNQRILKISSQLHAGTTQRQRVLYLPGLELRRTSSDDRLSEDLQVASVVAGDAAQVRALRWITGKPDDIDNDQLRYAYADHLGSASLEVDGEGAVISQEVYYPFGGTAAWSARSEAQGRYKTVRYSGKERDASGLYYYGFRYYQPWAGRWLSADPAGTVDGLNLYAMVANNPTTLVDSKGLKKQKGAKQSDGAPPAEPPSRSAVGAQSGDAPTPGSSRPPAEAREADTADAAEDDWEVVPSNSKSHKKKPSESQATSAVPRRFGIRGRSDERVYGELIRSLPTNRQGNKELIKSVGQRPNRLTGKSEIVFLEEGNDKEGLRHIIKRHGEEFKTSPMFSASELKSKASMTKEKLERRVIEVVMTAAIEGKVVGVQNVRNEYGGRPIYEVAFNGAKVYVAINVSTEGSVIGANTRPNVTAREKEDLKKLIENKNR